jgi:hypothetical protein
VNDFKIGDRVHVSNGGDTFTDYEDFFSENGLEYYVQDWAKDEGMPVGDYTIVATGKHSRCGHYGTLYLLRSIYGKIYIASNMYGYLTLVEREESKMIYASELMELARKEPQKYEGKRYKVAEGCAVDVISGERVYSIDIAGGRFYSNNYGVAITTSVVLEEIPPEPKPVTFMEAVEAYGKGETIRCKINHGGRTNEYDYIPQFTCDFGYKFVAKGSCEISSGEILRGKWFIVRKEC